jgi:hypothetical protein
MQFLQILMETRQNSGTNPDDFYDITLLLFLLIERSTYICKTGRYVFPTDLNIYHTSTSALPQFNPLCPRRLFHSTPNSVSLSLAVGSYFFQQERLLVIYTKIHSLIALSPLILRA